MKAGALHHVAVAVPSLDDALPFYTRTLGLAAGPVHDLTEQGVRAVFVGAAGALLELIEPTDPGSGVGRFVAERGRGTLHHVCYVVDDLASRLRELAAAGVELVDAAPRRGALGDVAFLHPRASGGVLVELLDRATLRAPHTGEG
ncbi:MAG TPA: VOC family protein [Candidatus Limnocylindria bacterium]|nr:VOC family protein [Candidatus Limnocylindria bacterium]